MHLLTTEAGRVARAVLEVLSAAHRGAPEINPEGARRLQEAVRGRLEAENDRAGLEALELFDSDPGEHPVPLLVILANKANADAGYRAHLRELVYAAGRTAP